MAHIFKGYNSQVGAQHLADRGFGHGCLCVTVLVTSAEHYGRPMYCRYGLIIAVHLGADTCLQPIWWAMRVCPWGHQVRCCSWYGLLCIWWGGWAGRSQH